MAENETHQGTADKVIRHELEGLEITHAYAGHGGDEDAREALDQPMLLPVRGTATLVGREELLASVRQDFGNPADRPAWANQWMAGLLRPVDDDSDGYVEVAMTPREYLDGVPPRGGPTLLEVKRNGPEVVRLMDRRHEERLAPVAFTIESYRLRAGWIVLAEHGNPFVDDALTDLEHFDPAPESDTGARP